MLIFMFLCLLCSGVISGFEIHWNVPTSQCSGNYKMDFVSLLRTFGILVNDGDKFQGESVTIFYDSQLGLYPKILKSGKMENGGIPQKGDLTKHLEKATKDLEKIIPSKKFNGLGVIDWESWRPTWEFNWEPLRIYQTKSIELAKELNPEMNATAIQDIARIQWENSSMSYMLETIRLAKKSRPEALWCFYLFPDCYNYVGHKPEDFLCSTAVKKGNDKLSWLWEASTAICPDIYVYENQLDKYTLEQRTWRDNGRLSEAHRVAPRNAKIFPYINYFDKELLPGEEFWRMLAQAAASGVDGAVIWGSSASVGSEDRCKSLKQYIIQTLGPAAEKVAWRSDLCSKQVCNGHGRCTWPNDESVKAWKFFTADSEDNFHAPDITCRCSDEYSGRFCYKSKK